MVITDTYLMLYISIVNELVEALNREAASGIITNDALRKLTIVDRETRKLARILHNAQAQSTPQQ